MADLFEAHENGNLSNHLAAQKEQLVKVTAWLREHGDPMAAETLKLMELIITEDAKLMMRAMGRIEQLTANLALATAVLKAVGENLPGALGEKK